MGISSSVEKDIEKGSETEDRKPRVTTEKTIYRNETEGQRPQEIIKKTLSVKNSEGFNINCICRLQNFCKSYKEKIAKLEESISALEDKRVRLYREHQCHHNLNGANCSSHRDIELLLQFLSFIEVRSIKILIQTNYSQEFVIDYLNRLGLKVGEAHTLYHHLKEELLEEQTKSVNI